MPVPGSDRWPTKAIVSPTAAEVMGEVISNVLRVERLAEPNRALGRKVPGLVHRWRDRAGRHGVLVVKEVPNHAQGDNQPNDHKR